MIVVQLAKSLKILKKLLGPGDCDFDDGLYCYHRSACESDPARLCVTRWTHERARTLDVSYCQGFRDIGGSADVVSMPSQLLFEGRALRNRTEGGIALGDGILLSHPLRGFGVMRRPPALTSSDRDALRTASEGIGLPLTNTPFPREALMR